jgi:hypothetical protein
MRLEIRRRKEKIAVEKIQWFGEWKIAAEMIL